MTKIWQTNATSTLNTVIESYTVGHDYTIDQRLIPYDIEASKAHAFMLHEMKIFTDEELHICENALDEILGLWKKGLFIIRQDQEDAHAAIETYITEHYGDIGKKIHTGRSRNDQSLVMIRLFMRDQGISLAKIVGRLSDSLNKNSQSTIDIKMPGYTHMQKAMPTTVGVWFGSYADAYTDIAAMLPSMMTCIDQNPLGSASGFGIANFPLQRSVTTSYLHFSRTQDNPLYCGMSRGYFESIFLNFCSPMMILAGKFAQDMLLFTMSEFGFFSLPPDFTTGSSIMPQKRNYDVFEVMRSMTKVYHEKVGALHTIVGSIGGGYQRDLQVTKKIFVEALDIVIQTLEALILCVENIQIHKDALAASLTDDLFMTERVYELVKTGVSFREAYQIVKKSLVL